MDERRHGSAHGGGVDHQDDRGIEQARDRRRAGFGLAVGRPVEETHDTFDDQNVGPGARPAAVRAMAALQARRADGATRRRAPRRGGPCGACPDCGGAWPRPS